MAKTEINYRKRIAREFYDEKVNLKLAKKWMCFSEEEFQDKLKHIAICKAKIELLAQLLKK